MKIESLKRSAVFIAAILLCLQATAQNKPKLTAPQVPCNGSADDIAGIYTDHTNPKYPSSLKGTAAEKAAMTKLLIAIEKLEETSRKDFKLTGCAARVSFSRTSNNRYGKIVSAGYGYQLGVYDYVCHVTEHVPKIVDEYRTVFRVDINPYIATGPRAGGTGEFAVSGPLRYEIPVEARRGLISRMTGRTGPARCRNI